MLELAWNSVTEASGAFFIVGPLTPGTMLGLAIISELVLLYIVLLIILQVIVRPTLKSFDNCIGKGNVLGGFVIIISTIYR